VWDKLSAAALALGALLVSIGAPFMVIGGNDQARIVGGVLTGIGCFGFLSGIALLFWPHRRSARPPDGSADRPASAPERAIVTLPVAPAPVIPTVERTEAVPTSSSRSYTDRTPEGLIAFLSGGLTDMQAQKLVAPFLGKWMQVSGAVSHVGDTGQVTFKGREVYMWFRGPEWLDRLAMLSPGSQISVVGRITKIQYSSVRLEDCELVD
jgi:hypothetical protein